MPKETSPEYSPVSPSSPEESPASRPQSAQRRPTLHDLFAEGRATLDILRRVVRFAQPSNGEISLCSGLVHAIEEGDKFLKREGLSGDTPLEIAALRVVLELDDTRSRADRIPPELEEAIEALRAFIPERR